MKPVSKLAAISAAAASVLIARRSKRLPDEAEAQPELTEEDRVFVETWVGDEVQRLRALSYQQLMQHEGRDFHSERLTPSGAYVMCETTVFWDDPDARTLRVIVDAAQPRSGFMPPSVATDDFIRAPDGSFVGEDRP